MLSALIGSINTNFGIPLGIGMKINLTDLLIGICLPSIFIKKITNKFKPIKSITIFLFFVIMGSTWGLINGSTFSITFRILRNIIYILLMFEITSKYYKKKKKERSLFNDVLIFSWVAIGNAVFSIALSFKEYHWFKYYRENSSFQVYMFIFLLLTTDKKNSIRKKVFKNITIILLGFCIFLSQERLQIVAVLGSLILYLGNSVINFFLKRYKFHLSGKKILITFMGLLVFIIILVKILEIEYIKNYIDYFVTYRIKSIVGDAGLVTDASLDGRSLQLRNILNRKLLFYFGGTGTGSTYLSAGGYTSIVDGMWLWIFKDLGILGLLLLFRVYISIFFEIKKIRGDYTPMLFGMFSILILQIFTPNIMLSISDSIFIGFLLAEIYLKKIPRKKKIKLDVSS